MNRSLKGTLSLILLLTAISGQLCQTYPETSASKNEEVAEEFPTNVQTLSQIEEENTEQSSEGDLKRQSRKVPCPFHKLKSGLSKAAAIPCGAAAGAAAAAVAGKSVGGSISGTSVGEASVGSGSFGRSSFGGSIGGSDTTEVEGGVHFGLTDTFDILNDRMLEMSASLHGALSSMQDLLGAMPTMLERIQAEIKSIDASPKLRYDVVQTCDNYAQTEKSVSGIINHIYNSFKLPFSKGGQVQTRGNFEIGSCLDNIKANMMNFLATIRSWFSCDKLFSSNKGISKLQSYIHSFPSSSQCSVLNGLGRSSGSYILVPHGSGEGQFGVRGSGGLSFNSNSQINEAVIGKQVQELNQIINRVKELPGMITSLIEEVEVGVNNQIRLATASQRTSPYVRTVQIAPVYHVPNYPQLIGSENIMSVRPSLSGQANININQKSSNIPTSQSQYYITSPQQTLISAPVACSGQSIIDNVYSRVSTSPIKKNTEAYLLNRSVGNINYDRSALDLLNIRVNLSRDTLYTLLKGHTPTAGDIIILNLTDDIMMVGSPSDDFSLVTFTFIYRGISSRTAHNNNVFVWNVSEDDFSCNPNIFNDIVAHLVYG
ncbi:uncharacterized protein [Chelonus insularis]|uniref:uncharacterized protein n=1 Tax=Chelonus insularis TaxID=460826 RepID=UPI00158BB099|nr:uncharacterized protein LOC118066327 [Chelonus insularis]